MNYNSLKTNEYIRFEFNLSNGFLDPYSVYFDMEIERGANMGNADLYLDGHSTSMINELIIS